MQVEGMRSSVDPMTEFVVITACGRRMDRQAFDYESLIRDLHFRGLKPVFIQPLSEYEAEIHAKEEQERLNHELKEEIERELKESA